MRWLGPLRHKRVRVGILLAILALIVMSFGFFASMPGKSFAGTLPPLTPGEEQFAKQLRTDVEHLAGVIGERNVSQEPEKLHQSAVWLEQQLTEAGCSSVTSQAYNVDGMAVRNIIVEFPGTTHPEEILIVGAHYDSVIDCPGANDNASGTAGLLALARIFALDETISYARTLRLVFFVNEEPPWFQQQEMGSLVYARQCHARKENIIGMISLETIGYYSDKKGSQSFPIPVLRPFFPSTGNFIGFVGSTHSRSFIRRVVSAFRQHTSFPSEGAAIPQAVPGTGWSDHWSFEIHGYPALMATDTAPFRYPYYHQPGDTPEKLHYPHMARVIRGLQQVIADLLTDK